MPKDGVSHWGDTKVIASLAAVAVLLVSFALIEWRSRHASLPLRVLASRNRSGAYLIMLAWPRQCSASSSSSRSSFRKCWASAREKSGLAALPFAAMIVVMSGIVSQLVGRVGAPPLTLTGAAVTAGGVYWFSQVTEHSTYINGLLGHMLVTSASLGMLFVPLSLVALTRVRGEDSGVASSLLNTGQQVGGAIGLAARGTVTWTAVSKSVKHQVAQAAAAAAHADHPRPAARPGASVPAAVLHQALATGISRGFRVAAGTGARAGDRAGPGRRGRAVIWRRRARRPGRGSSRAAFTPGMPARCCCTLSQTGWTPGQCWPPRPRRGTGTRGGSRTWYCCRSPASASRSARRRPSSSST
ncbi:MAG TPA: hypothetical protein VK586_06755 [Streptosporangiaceae bacterium]|nr:hypothetical protein [Streptosporangiaceae bacterium]